MTRLLISTAIAGLFALATPAFAQGHDDHRDRGDHNRPAPAAAPAAPAQAQPQQRGGDRRGPQAAQNNAPPQDNRRGGFANFRGQQQQAQADQRSREDRRSSAGAQNAPAAEPAPQQAMRAQGPQTDTRGPNTDRRAFGNNDRGGFRGQDNNVRRGPDTAMRAPNNSMRGPDNAARPSNRNFASFQRNFTAPHRFHAAAYRRPRGWYSHHWVFGEILPALFWTQDYWLDDYMDFGLEPPPPGTVWVRDGYDALLIDRYSGEIIQVDYNVFY